MVGKLTPDDMMSCSRLPALLGFSKYRTPNDELKYTMNAIKGIDNEFIDNEPMQWGNAMEAMILTESATRLGLESYDLSHDKAYFHDKIRLACSLDGTATGQGQEVFTDVDRGIFVMGQESIKLDGLGILEAKLTSNEVESEPAVYRGVIQIQGQMDIMGAKWGALCVLYRGTQLRIFLYAPNQDQINMIHQAVDEFQSKIEKFKLNEETDWYPLTNSQEATRLFDHADKITVDIPEIELQAEKILELRETIHEAESAIDRLQANIMQQMRDAEVCNAGRYKISWPMRKYNAQPPKMVPAKQAYVIRQSKISIRDRI